MTTTHKLRPVIRPDFGGSGTKANKLIKILFGADLRSGHNGLFKQAAVSGYNIDKLGIGEYVCFVNKKKTGVKMFASGRQMLGYFKSEKGQITAQTIRALPRYFNGQELKYPESLRETIAGEVRTQP